MAVSSSGSEDKKIPKYNVEKKKLIAIYIQFIFIVIYQCHTSL